MTKRTMNVRTIRDDTPRSPVKADLSRETKERLNASPCLITRSEAGEGY